MCAIKSSIHASVLNTFLFVQQNSNNLLKLSHKHKNLKTEDSTVNKLQMHKTHPERPHKSAMRGRESKSCRNYLINE